MATRNLSIRLSVKDAEIVRRALEGLGEDGQRALGRLETASRKASRGTLALNDAMGEVRGTMQGYANQLGPLGAGLTALGPAGLAAAAGIGAAVLGLGAAMREAREAVAAFDQVAKTADRLGVSTDALQELRFAADLAGVSTQTLDMALQRFTRRAAEAAQGTGEAKDALAQLGITLTDANGNLRPAEDLLGDVADALAEIEDPAKRLLIAQKLFDSEGVVMVNMLGDGSKALEETRRQARELGLVVEEDLLRNAEDLNDKLSIASQVIDTRLKVAFIELAPIIAEVTEAIAGMARGITELLARFKDVEDVSLGVLQREAQRLRGDLATLSREGVFGVAGLSRTTLLEQMDPRNGTLSALVIPQGRSALQERLRAQLDEVEAEIRRRSAEGPLEIDVSVPYDPGDEQPPPPPPPPGGNGGSAEVIDLRGRFATRPPPIPVPRGMTREQMASAQRILEATNRALTEYDERLRRAGEAIRREMMTPTEQLDARLAELNTLLDAGAIDAETFGRAVSKAWEDFGAASESAVEQTGRARDAVRELGLSFESAFEDAIVNGERLSEVLRGLFQDVVRLTLRKAIVEPGAAALSGVLESAAGGLLASLFHDGGRVGGLAPVRAVPTEIFRDAPRLHSGGGIGLRSDEVPAILQRGEVVLPRRAAHRQAPPAAPTVVINIQTPDVAGFRQSQTQIAAALQRALSRGQRNM